MGNSSTKLSEDVALSCEELAKDHSSITLQSIKKIAVAFQQKTAKNEVKTPEELLSLLEVVNYFEMHKKNMLGKVSSNSDEEKMKRNLITFLTDSKDYQTKKAHELFKLFDRDHSGTISTKEFLSGIIVTLFGNPQERLQVEFDLYDADGNGVISREEFSTGYLNAYEAVLNFRKTECAIALTCRTYGSLSVDIDPQQLEQIDFTTLFVLLQKELGEIFDELYDIVRSLGQEIIDLSFPIMDSNNDQVISKSEYMIGIKDPTLKQKVQNKIDERSQCVHEKIEEKMSPIIEKWCQIAMSNLK